MKRKTFVGVVTVLVLALALPVLAEDHEAEPGAFAKNIAFVGERAVQLAEAIPADQYGWRPMEGVRSVSEAIMHMAGANYFLSGALGMAPPQGIDPQSLESITDKTECIATLEASLEHLQKALDGVEDRGKEVEAFGSTRTAEEVMLMAVGHVHEHFGQLIAYARSNEVVPPWSRKQE